jgi:hypothetical protein
MINKILHEHKKQEPDISAILSGLDHLKERLEQLGYIEASVLISIAALAICESQVFPEEASQVEVFHRSC